MEQRVGIGYDSHRFSESRVLYIGGVKIPYKFGLEGHSDADVLIHALIDALLGAAALGDIGALFPDVEEKYKNIRSSILLKEALKRVHNDGWDIENIDATVIAEEPKLIPFTRKINENLSKIIGINLNKINVKATTNEGMGFVGRKEGIVALAVVLLERGE
ncbi:MAG: 2-C-methyl-D-erythritol 2,4-cyclodiphosphate synthase [Caldisericaceae bacterium]|nr:2-C-methyl-D-erythritol 2,4-cyclodiphosphate synthase [Caldisericaceae bacterium]